MVVEAAVVCRSRGKAVDEFIVLWRDKWLLFVGSGCLWCWESVLKEGEARM